ncbi:hypothetical protein GGR57DRAFT_503092 [Xylariaceae sp. FL1272]|nr:hypothetical protein GGR57DRAFT_503092 [Xylariaceae sp. FL1272]
MSSDQQLTLFLWLEGFFPRRINYYLLLKNLVKSPADLLACKTTEPNLNIVRMSLAQKGWSFTPSDDPLPAEISTSTPCLRVRNTATGGDRWVRESASILVYLETLYGDRGPALKPSDHLDIAAMDDLVGCVSTAFAESLVYARHASPFLARGLGVKDEDRSPGAARNAHATMVRQLVKVQSWGSTSLNATGWLTPGVDGPGLVDLCLASGRRYMELGYGFDYFENEELGLLREWYERFRSLSWWEELEERTIIHPEFLRNKMDDVIL